MTNEDAKKNNESQQQGKSSANQEEQKSETSQMKVVQDKKKELEDRMKSQGTIRLRQPGSGARPQQGTEGQTQQTEQEQSDTYKFGPQGKAAEAGKTQATEGGQPQETGAKRTLKIKSGGAGGAERKTMKIGGDKGKEAGGPQGQEPAAAAQAQQAPAYAGAGMAQSAGPGKAGFLANVIVFLASAVTFTFLLLYFIDFYI